MTRPRVGISACLLGEAVRYDGGHKQSVAALALADDIDWVQVCPEVDVGMGVPREPVHLEQRGDGPRLIGAESGQDWTDAMQTWARARLEALGRVDGWVLKSRSPSCGLAVTLRGAPSQPVAGLFAHALRVWVPDLPCVEEDALADPVRRAAFLDAVRARFATDDQRSP